jgi:hypothetical protein
LKAANKAYLQENEEGKSTFHEEEYEKGKDALQQCNGCGRLYFYNIYKYEGIDGKKYCYEYCLKNHEHWLGICQCCNSQYYDKNNLTKCENCNVVLFKQKGNIINDKIYCNRILCLRTYFTKKDEK